MNATKPVVELIERENILAALDLLMLEAAEGVGRIAFISGEAGVGKTSLLRSATSKLREARVWWGNCDALQTPHPLAPLHDVARNSDTTFAPLLRSADRVDLFNGVLNDILSGAEPTVFVVEDAHWADDATLDLIRFVGRRISRSRALLLVSYRDDEVSAYHPLRAVIGDLPEDAIARIDVPRLTRAAVESLARRALRSPDGIFEATLGNAFFVSELLRAGSASVPRSVKDVVLARYARLSAPARSIIDTVSIVPGKAERRIVEALLPQAAPYWEECENSGLLRIEGDFVGFRHELARGAVEEMLPSLSGRRMHQQMLHLLREYDDSVSPARLAHHAARSENLDAIVSYLPTAAHEAQEREAHREAAAHFRRLVDCTTGNDMPERTAWLEGYAGECGIIGAVDEAIEARRSLDEIFERRGDVEARAINLCLLSSHYITTLRNNDAEMASRDALRLLEARRESLAHFHAYRTATHLRMLDRECADAVEWGERTISIAERLGRSDLLASALATVGTARLFLDFEVGRVTIERALALANELHLHQLVAQTLTNLGSAAGELFHFGQARDALTSAIEFSSRHDKESYRQYATSWLAFCDMRSGRYEDATERAQSVILEDSEGSIGRLIALVALGRTRSRQGSDDYGPLLDEALELALRSDTIQRVAPVRAARAEAALLRGDMGKAMAEADAALPLAVRREHQWFAGELQWLRHRAGVSGPTVDPCAEPFALQIAGRVHEAAAYWERLAAPFERAQVLEMGNTAEQLLALKIYDELGAKGAAAALRGRLRAAGVRGVPRGRQASTRANPFDLTAREYEILTLVCEGRRNAEIAEELYLSVRTIEHHVAAVFGKLGVVSRAEAIVKMGTQAPRSR